MERLCITEGFSNFPKEMKLFIDNFNFTCYSLPISKTRELATGNGVILCGYCCLDTQVNNVEKFSLKGTQICRDGFKPSLQQLS